MTQPLLLTGATGNTGAVIAEELSRRGVPFVAMARSPEARARLRDRGYATVHGDFDDPESLDEALRGVERAYLVSTPDETLYPRMMNFVTAAQLAGVRHVVACTAYRSGPRAESANLRAHGNLERALRASSLAWTVLRPHGFMQTFTLFSWAMIEEAGVLSFPAGDGAMALVDVRDVAAVAVKALTEPGHEGKAYDLTGPEALRFDQIAATLSMVLGKSVVYLPGDDASMDLVARLLGVPAVPREHVRAISVLTRAHQLETVHDTLEGLGVRPTTYETFVRDLVAGRTGGGNSFRPPDHLAARVVQRLGPAVMRLRRRFAAPA